VGDVPDDARMIELGERGGLDEEPLGFVGCFGAQCLDRDRCAGCRIDRAKDAPHPTGANLAL
jgi:hypothetical protein